MKHSKGTVVVCATRGMLRLQIPRHLFSGEQKYLYLGLPDTPINRSAALVKAQAIEADIAFDRFDTTLKKYKPPYLEQVKIPDLSDLWKQYTIYKGKVLSSTTIKREYRRVATHISKFPCQKTSRVGATRIRQHLIKTSSLQTAKKILEYLSACCEWARGEDLLTENPFSFLPKVKGKTPKKPIHPFSKTERDLIINGFESSDKWRHYTKYVEFLFLTGCRTSEAVGIQWKHIDTNASLIHFREALVDGSRKDTKTHKARVFPINKQLGEVIASLRRGNPEDLVFTDPDGKPIDSRQFTKVVWTEILEWKGIEYRVQYNPRHSFITYCLEAGIQVAQIAQWVGNSPATIWTYYAGVTSLQNVPDV
ncbi:MAG TPA: site-specific integrase [Cyanobacteria bacterium UBA11159]|nr:site-specific integrase [Cyanobacteria bacterium UBA11159]